MPLRPLLTLPSRLTPPKTPLAKLSTLPKTLPALPKTPLVRPKTRSALPVPPLALLPMPPRMP